MVSTGEMPKDSTQRDYSTPTSTIMIKGLPSRTTEPVVRIEFLFFGNFLNFTLVVGNIGSIWTSKYSLDFRPRMLS
jgi:hypothetical protein